MMTKVIKN